MLFGLRTFLLPFYLLGLLFGFFASSAWAAHTPITGYSGNVRVHVSTTSGTIYFDANDVTSLSAVTGYPSADWTSGASNEIVFQGTQSNVNTALGKLKHSTGIGNVLIVHSPEGVAYNPSNGHFYQYVSGSFNYAQADSAAEAGPFPVGDIGYLATIGSLSEYEFLRTKTAQSCWLAGYISGTDQNTEGAWVYTGGEPGMDGFQFWDGGRTGHPKNSQTHWSSIWGSSGTASNQPDNSGGNEDAIDLQSCYQVNDIPVTNTIGYYAEYASAGGNAITSTSQTIVSSDFYVPTIQFSTSNSSGLESVSTASISVDLNMRVGRSVVVNYTLSGTATGFGSDYTTANGTLTIPANTSSANITISSIVDDNLYEGNETVIVTLSNPSGATLGTNTAHTYTITENDTIPSLTIADISSAEGAFGANLQPNIRVSLSHPSTQSISFQWETQDGTATSADTDYSVEAGATLYISAGDMFVDIPPVILGDDAFENDENFSILLTNAVNATIADNTGVVTITNDDSAPSLSVSLLGNAIEGNGNALLRIEPSTVAGLPITFDYTTSDGTASAGAEYSFTSGTATINAGVPDISISVPIIDNNVDNSDKNFTFTISNSTNATIAVSSASVSIIDDEATISINDITVNETANSATLTVTVQGPITATNVDVDYTTANGTATVGNDYTLNSGTINFSSSSTPPFGVSETKTITISLSDDAIVEGVEYFDVNLSNIVSAGSVVMSDGVGRITITDNDAATVDFNVTSSSGAESVSSAVLQVDLSAQSTSAVTVDYTVTGTATGGGTDFRLANGTLTIPANTSSADITIASIVDDALVEGSETVIVTLANPSGAILGTDTAHTYTITDNDFALPVASVSASASVSEGAGSHNFTISLDVAATAPLSVDYMTADGTALAASDYNALSGTLNFAVGEQSKTVSVTIVDDSETETAESFSLSLSNPSGLTIGTSSLTVSIIDNDNDVNEARLKEAENFVRDMSDQLAQEKGQDLIEASHRLIRASLDSLLITSRVAVSSANTDAPQIETGFSAEDSVKVKRQIFFARPETPILDRQEQLTRNLIGAVKSLDVDADEDSYRANFDYDLYTPIVRSNDRLITKIAAQTSKQKNGPEARRLVASIALEKQAGDEQSALGRFIHLTHENADFNTSYKGDKNTSAVNLGIYKVYTVDADMMNSIYFSAGIGDTDLSLTKDGMLMESSYLSYQFQTGFSAGRVYKSKNFMGMVEFSIDGLYDYQTGHQLNITSGLNRFNRIMSGKTRYEVIGRLEPKFNFELGRNAKKVSIFQLIPLVKCGTGSMDVDCGGGVSAKISSAMAENKGHLSFGLRYEHYRDTDFMEYMVNINQNLFANDNIKLKTDITLDTDKNQPSKNRQSYSVGSRLNVTF